VTEEELARPPRVLVLPVPYEATTSYETGTRLGPQAILHASQQVELYDPERGSEPIYRYGVRTAPFLSPPPADPAAFLEEVAGVVEEHARAGRFVLLLGGEHTLSVAAGRGLRRVFGPELAVAHFDAHSDLRASYQGEVYSHACAARRLLEEGCRPIVQVGIRAWSLEEARFIEEHPGEVTVIAADRIHRDPEQAEAELASWVRGRRVFLTFDVDCLDPAVMPATGTPEPDGLSWREAVGLLRAVTGGGQVVGMDCVELSPRPGLHHAEFTTARLLYRVLNDLFA
jgi:agmatinase